MIDKWRNYAAFRDVVGVHHEVQLGANLPDEHPASKLHMKVLEEVEASVLIRHHMQKLSVTISVQPHMPVTVDHPVVLHWRQGRPLGSSRQRMPPCPPGREDDILMHSLRCRHHSSWQSVFAGAFEIVNSAAASAVPCCGMMRAHALQTSHVHVKCMHKNQPTAVPLFWGGAYIVHVYTHPEDTWTLQIYSIRGVFILPSHIQIL